MILIRHARVAALLIILSVQPAAAHASLLQDAADESRTEPPTEYLILRLSMEVSWLPESGMHVPEKPPAPAPQQVQPAPAVPEQSGVAAAPPATPYNEIEAGFSHERFDQYYEPWQAAYITASRQFSEATSAYATYRQTRRYGLNDHEIWAGYYASPLAHWNAHIEGSLSPTHRILARWSLLGQLGYTFDNGIGTSMGMRRTTYETASNNSIGVLVERYFGKLRAAAGTWKSRLDIGGEWVEYNQLQAEYYYGDRNYVGLYYNSGQEVFVGWNLLPETAGSSSWTASGTHWVTRDWAATYSYLQYSQEDWYTRSGFNIGARHRF